MLLERAGSVYICGRHPSQNATTVSYLAKAIAVILVISWFKIIPECMAHAGALFRVEPKLPITTPAKRFGLFAPAGRLLRRRVCHFLLSHPLLNTSARKSTRGLITLPTSSSIYSKSLSLHAFRI
ncbi:hypothetical protein P175DRAFT_0373806 [Aspergillus ochraceoroseus IBT 24754]|uniref:Uncharacterized protein n=1 Tax=Aspergillus ochraceoroseus IBT 24754 TaxID=1392256 RepID=A0A2T5LN38_9EURO|nr:uncharacterized protein P175DRAFT_0373806 [Aspergillus ochraceoroseus IBT 24754]PTU17699.1 hypothetical protein P175DRAFT_0373806 [Aspergillus ochraceoroseus IBT 24754]